MPTFPTISKDPVSFTEEPSQDPTIRSKMENGKVFTRAKYTTIPKKWTMAFRFLTQAEYVLLEALEDTVGIGAATFTWTNPKTAVEFTVRLAGPIVFSIEPTHYDQWAARMVLVEA
jgi:hypothetical protein